MLVIIAMSLIGCRNMSRKERNTVVGAVAGGIAGNALTRDRESSRRHRHSDSDYSNRARRNQDRAERSSRRNRDEDRFERRTRRNRRRYDHDDY